MSRSKLEVAMSFASTTSFRERLLFVWQSLRGGSGGTLASQLIRGGIGAAIVKVASLGFTFAVTVYLARLLGPEEFGLYSFVFSLISVAAVVPQFGLPGLLIRETARSVANEDYGRLLGAWRWGGRFTLLICLAVMALGLLAPSLFGATVPALESRAYRFGLWLVPLLSLGALRSGALRGLGRVVQGLLPELVLIPALLLAFVVSIWLFSPASLNAHTAMGAHVAAAAVAFTVGLVLLHRSRPEALRASVEPTYDARSWRRSAVPMAVIMGMTILFRQTDTVMVGLMTTEKDVGIYRVAAQWAWLVTLGGQIVNFVIPPFIARFYVQGDKRRLQLLATRTAVVSALIGLPPLVAFVILGKPIIAFVFGSEYSDAFVPLAILSVAQMFNMATGSSGALLAMTKFEQDSAKVLGFSVLANIGLNAAFIPMWGPVGAAVAGAFTIVILKTLLWRVVRLRLGIDPTVFGRAVS